MMWKISCIVHSYQSIVELGKFFDEDLFDHVGITNHKEWLAEEIQSKKSEHNHK